MERHCILEEGIRTFCFEHEGPLAAARIMAEHHLPEVLVLNAASAVVGAYTLSPEGIRFRAAGSDSNGFHFPVAGEARFGA